MKHVEKTKINRKRGRGRPIFKNKFQSIRLDGCYFFKPIPRSRYATLHQTLLPVFVASLKCSLYIWSRSIWMDSWIPFYLKRWLHIFQKHFWSVNKNFSPSWNAFNSFKERKRVQSRNKTFCIPYNLMINELTTLDWPMSWRTQA